MTFFDPLTFTRDFRGRLRLIESKFGPTADFTDSQKIGYPEVGSRGGKVVGGKLASQGLPNGSSLKPTDVLVDWW